MDPAIWEAQRLDGAHRFTLRCSSAEVDLDGQHIPEGELLMAFLAAGNRDPAVWPTPTRSTSSARRLATITATGATWPTASASTTAGVRPLATR